MSNRFVISDTHFGHTNSWQLFKNADGSPLRPFSSNEEMDETMVENWNSIVGEKDTVYHLGDVVIARRNLQTVKRLNGRKILIRGNHDMFKDKDFYDAGFESLRGCQVFSGKYIFTHIPIHPESLGRFRVNVHGHLHGNEVMWERTYLDETDQSGSNPYRRVTEPDPRYMSVCVEKTGFKPISFDELEQRIQDRWEKTGYVPTEPAWGNGSGPG